MAQANGRLYQALIKLPLAIMALGLFTLNTNLSQNDSFRGSVDSVAGPKLLYPDNTIQQAGLWVTAEGSYVRPFRHMADDGIWSTVGNANFFRNFVVLSAACFATRAEVIEKAGGFRSGKSPVLDLCEYSRRAGLRVLWSPYARLRHRGPDLDEKPDRVIEADPFLNPNIAVESTNGAVRER